MDNMENFIEVNNLSVSFDVRAGLLLRKIGTIQAVNNVSFSIKKGEILGGTVLVFVLPLWVHFFPVVQEFVSLLSSHKEARLIVAALGC